MSYLDEPELIEPAYTDLFAWVFEWFLPTAERRTADGPHMGIYWCAQWWAHPEGLQRIYCLWREWEKARAQDAMSQWWRDHLDPHLHALTTEHGPFARCSPSRHYQPMHLTSHQVPAQLAELLPEGSGQAAADGETPGENPSATNEPSPEGHTDV